MPKPSVTTACVADKYAAPNERIIEITGQTAIGCLISIRNMADGTVQIDVYHADAGVVVNGPATRA